MNNDLEYKKKYLKYKTKYINLKNYIKQEGGFRKFVKSATDKAKTMVTAKATKVVNNLKTSVTNEALKVTNTLKNSNFTDIKTSGTNAIKTIVNTPNNMWIGQYLVFFDNTTLVNNKSSLIKIANENKNKSTTITKQTILYHLDDLKLLGDNMWYIARGQTNTKSVVKKNITNTDAAKNVICICGCPETTKQITQSFNINVDNLSTPEIMKEAIVAIHCIESKIIKKHHDELMNFLPLDDNCLLNNKSWFGMHINVHAIENKFEVLNVIEMTQEKISNEANFKKLYCNVT